MTCPKCNSTVIERRPEKELKVGAITLPAGIRFTCRTCKYAWLETKEK